MVTSVDEETRNRHHSESFESLLNEHERALRAYVYHLIPHAADAQDILQETRLAMWNAFDQYKPGTHFSAWSKKVAYYRVLAFRKKKSVESRRLIFSDACMEYLSETYHDAESGISAEAVKLAQEDQSSRLQQCLSRLKDHQKKLIAMRYQDECEIDEIAQSINKSSTATYRALSRVRLSLRKCLQRITP